MKKRVVVTGLGVVSPIGNTLEDFEAALKSGRSGIRKFEALAELNFKCQVGGIPPSIDAIATSYFDEEERMAMNNCMTYACIAAIDAWTDAGLELPERPSSDVLWDTGAVVGSGAGGVETLGSRVVPLTDAGQVKRLGSMCVEQIMSSNLSAKIGGLFGLGNQVTSNSSACATGAEAIYMAAERIRTGQAVRMLAGGSEGVSRYIWSAFDAMRVLARKFNDRPSEASRPMSASAAGFVPSAGAGVLMLEDLDSALERGARVHAEVLGGAVNSGGHRNGGSMTAPNTSGVQRCITSALSAAGIDSSEVDAISGHLTGTFADPLEVSNWSHALGRRPGDFPWITAPKSLFGHALGAAGAIETVAAILMLGGGYVHPSCNCEDLHPDVEPFADSVPHELKQVPDLRTVMKSGFGFGDVNCCLVFRSLSN
jgi:3-oxoacyl-(acyl-carrier-protein) synthase